MTPTAPIVQTPERRRAYVRPISLADLPELRAAATGDGHAVIAPTHVAVRAGSIVGYASIGAYPLMVCWAHTAQTSRTEGFRFLREVETFAAERYPHVALACTPGSPFRPYLERLDYQFVANVDLLLKKVK